MAMRCSPNSGVGSRIVVIKLLMIYGPISRSFLLPELQFWNKLCCLKIWDLSMMIVWCVTIGYGLTC